MYIWALDISLSSTGITIFNQDGTHIFIDSIGTDSKQDTSVRLHNIGQRILQLKQNYPPAKLIIERGFSRFNTSTEQVYRAVGVVEYCLWDIDKIYYPATTVKKEITGKGNAKKFEVEAVICAKYPDLRFKNLDESDSFAIGLTYFYKEGILK